MGLFDTARVAYPVRPIALLIACAGPGIRTGKPVQFTEPRAKPAGEGFPNWPHPPLIELEEFQEFDQSAHKVRDRSSAGGGVTGAGISVGTSRACKSG